MSDNLSLDSPSSSRFRTTIRRCIDDWFFNHAGVVPAYADETSLLSLGLDSLAAAGLAMDLSDALGCAVSDEELFDHPSVSELGALLDRRVPALALKP